MSLRAEMSPITGSVLIFQTRGAVAHLIEELKPEDAREFGSATLEAGKRLIVQKPSLEALAEVGERR